MLPEGAADRRGRGGCCVGSHLADCRQLPRIPSAPPQLRQLFGYSPMDDPEFRAGGVRKEALSYIKGQLWSWLGEHGELPVAASQGENVAIALVPQISLGALAPRHKTAALSFRYLNRPGVTSWSLAPGTVIVVEGLEEPNLGQWLLLADGLTTCETGRVWTVGEVVP
jgi:hypothetical protein